MAEEADREEPITRGRRSRRELLAGAAGALGVIAAEAIGRPTPSMADNGGALILGQDNTATSPTELDVNDGACDGLIVKNLGLGNGILGTSALSYGYLGWGQSSPGFGVYGAAPGGTGVFGDSGSGTGVLGQSNVNTGVYGLSGAPSGTPTNGSVIGGVVGDSNTNAGVVGLTSAPTRAAGEFTHTAGQAQLRLHPSSALTHPTNGQRGDLFVDKSGRLWFCKGGTNWVQLA